MKNLILVITLLLSTISSAYQIAGGALFVVDISGSMSNLLEGIKRNIETLASSEKYASLQMGLMSFSGCGVSEVFTNVPVGRGNREAIIREAKALNLRGSTDIHAALVGAKALIEKQLADTKECLDLIIFTDDEDTCGTATSINKGIVAELAKMCSAENQTFKIDVIANTTSKGAEYLAEVLTDSTGGTTYNVGSAKEGNEKLKEILDKKVKKNASQPSVITSTSTPPPTGGKKPVSKPAEQKKPAEAKASTSKPETKTNVGGGGSR